jgi:hypothetical protein
MTLTSRTVAVYTALAILVTLAVAVGASSAVASSSNSGGPRLSGLRPAPDAAAAPTTADQPQSGGPRLSGLRPAPDAAVAPSDEGGFPWGAAAIGSVLALGLTGLGISRARGRTRPGPAALSH